ncbi:hypothetical protein I2I05_08555 [Hymenobacter sp. BT683]|uniref:Phage major capsid protein n=1 Tax=Hymenobacter jeongseonensis TaxID=2791027 RepID=A0ABS0IGZ4_9BACT|nr:hypothetical protein [Hymenobacter jeongseonensis]MBF9237447.1 hypothetical protein [Hymenobacter jeongseonensis]
MAFESINVNYVGRDAKAYISRATLGAKSIAGGYVTPQTNVSVPTSISVLEVGQDLIQAYSSDFVAKGGYTLSQRMLVPKHLMINIELDKQILLSSWEADKMKAGAMNKDIPDDFFAYVTSKIEESANMQVEANLWRGAYNVAGGYTQKFDGYLTLAAASGSTAVKVTGTEGATLSKANIKAALAKAYESAPDEISEKEGFKLYVSPGTAKAYRMSLGDYENQSTVGRKPLDFEGIEVVPTAGIVNKNIIVGTTIDNLIFGTDLVSDLNAFAVKDMFESTLEQKIRVRAEMFACANFAFGEEFVLYTAGA